MEENKNIHSESETPISDEILTAAAQGGAQKPKKNWKKEAREWIVSIAAALLVVFFIRTFLFQIIRVDGHSMDTTLADNERLMVSVLDVRLNGVERGDIVICHYPNRGRTNFVKRAVAVPGDQVYRANGVTHVVYKVDGEIVDEMLDERMLQYFLTPSSDDYEPYTLGENEYFVVGDNRSESYDSRAGDMGMLHREDLLGRVRCALWPFRNIE